ncbi:TPA: hypothetical protein N0F65_008324 [Lagenidium giganteum]|uniref:Phorbol-ester/DAG-type domain-containing protein n=1 Tax=Lagenidium giganteum TaxID=4803 RepID=A0AAV2YS74_9STRA|nr:TPA: hypothetical protein N0F65_008324 [Lagenidium giganteum]
MSANTPTCSVEASASDAATAAAAAAGVSPATTASMMHLFCGRCRKKTAEVVSKLCTSCGVPLHVSCSNEVAVRECELQFGFPLTAAYCSKRCYDADLLSNASHVTAINPTTTAVASSTPSGNAVFGLPLKARRVPQVPNEITASLTVKIGHVNRTSRKHLAITTFRFLVSEGFEVFKAKANTRTHKELMSYNGPEVYVREDVAIYIKPGVHSKQAEFVELTEKNFEARIARSYRNFLKRKVGENDSFECDVLTYVKKDTQQRPRVKSPISAGAASLSNVARSSSATGLQSYIEYANDHSTAPDGNVGLSSMQVPAVDSTMPNSSAGGKRKHSQMLGDGTMHSPQVSDGLDSAHDPNAYKSIRMILNGSVVSVKVNVRDLLSVFGVLIPQFPSAPEESSGPTPPQESL